jgi:outer membrane receptor protein involved in Fe transport
MPAYLFWFHATFLAAAAGQEPEDEVGETLILAPAPELDLPRAVAVSVGADELAATGERSLPRALARASGVWVQETNLGGGAVVLNGLLGNRVLIVVDGVRLNDSTTRSGPNQSLNGIDPRTVERIDVVRGPGTLLYGSDAVGGAILIRTRRRAPAVQGGEGWRGGLDADFGTAAGGGRASLSASYAEGAHGALGIGSVQEYGDLRAGGGETQDPTGYGGTAWFASYDLDLGDGRGLRIAARRTRDLDVPRTDRLRPGFGQTQPSNAVWDYELQDRSSWLASYTDDAGALADRMEARLSLRRYTEDRRIRSLGSTTETYERDEVETVGVACEWRRALGEDHLLTWGVGADADAVDSKAADTDVTTGIGAQVDGAFAEDARYLSSGVFARDEVFAFEPWILTAGARYSFFDFAFDDFPANGGGRVHGDFDAWVGSLSAQRELSDSLTATATLGQSFRAPNLEDLANNSSFAGGTELANSDLDPERSLTAQLAFDLAREPWSGYLGLHSTWIDDVISRTLLSAGGPAIGDETYQRDNAGEATVLGADLGAARALGGPGSPWSLAGRLSWTYGTQEGDNLDPDDPTEDEVPFQRLPPLFGELALRWDRPAPQRSLHWAALAARFAGDQERLHPLDELDPRIGADGTDGWLVFDVDWGGPLGAGGASRWNAGIHNLLDENYRVHASGIDAPGFQLVFGLSLVL